MFTGIVEDLGTIHQVVQKKNLVELAIRSEKIAEGAKLGSSICVDGACLTVCRQQEDVLYFDVMLETLDKTVLGRYSVGQRVNLERALQLSDRIDGHLVSGHVDCVATLTDRVTEENYLKLKFSLSDSIARFVVPKGSITINGVSLTVGEVSETEFSVYLIPVTERDTNLGILEIGQSVNLEVDLLARYVEKQLQSR